MKKLRCAIYTRKSSEEGLDQTFNSLDAQREACEAYIASQKSERWSALRANYDDGGWSGGSMERPGLAALLADIAAGSVDIVVVYKVDRLTRSLADFARMVDLFDRHEVSFVSVTQAFNTTSSMGRLTLNVLLSFAQFEREVTGERIRDKIAASKARGMWMGGYPPLGYEPHERTLVINVAEATNVRLIFERYLALGSVHSLARELEADGITSKRWTSSTGVTRGGVPISRGALFHLLRNRIYLGEIVHKTVSHPGQHTAIVDRNIFEAVQKKLDGNAVGRKRSTKRNAPLAGLLYDAGANRMSPTHAGGRGGRRYRYYASAVLQTGKATCDAAARRIPAQAIEDAVVERLRRWSGRPAASLTDLTGFVTRLVLHEDSIVADITPPAHEDWTRRICKPERFSSPSDTVLRVMSPIRFCARGGPTSLVEAAVAGRRPHPDRALIAGLRRAHAELEKRGIDMMGGRDRSEDAKGMGDPYLRKLSSLAFLAPDIQRAILDGRQPAGLTLGNMLARQIPLEWHEQRSLLGFENSIRS